MGVNQTATQQPASASPLDAFLHSKLFTIIIVIALGALGYWLAPADLTLGDYSAQITIDLDGTTHTIDYPFSVDQTGGEAAILTESINGYTVTISGQEAYAYKISERISYQVTVTDEAGDPIDLPLENISSTITGHGGINYAQILPATDRAGDALVFTMRMPFKARITTGLLFSVAALWLTEVVPLSAGSLLIPVVIVVAGVTDPNTVLQPFFHRIIVLFLAGFLMAEAMRRTGIDRLIALNILQRSSTKPALLMLAMMGITAFLSMWMSNTASVAIIIPIALAILDKIPNSENTSFHKALILGVAYAGAMGGIGSAIGTPANMLALTFLSEYGDSVLTFNDWFAYGLPMVLVMVPIIWVYLLLTFRVNANDDLDKDIYAQEIRDMGPLSNAQKLIFAVFIAVVLLWLTESYHHIHSSIVALGGALVLFFAEVLHKDDLNRLNWDALLTFGGGLSIGSLLVMTGVSDWIALQLIGLTVLPQIVVIFLVAALTMIIGAFISNTACAAMLIPLAIPLAQILQIDTRLMVAIIAIGSSIDFALVVGTPPTMMAYSTGFFKTSEIFRRGVILDVIGVTILSLGVIWVWRLLGVVSF
jgi:sodium-dependent dicarboxylate transporter 2/3/5